MKILSLTILLNLFCLVTIGQSKLILHKGTEREIIKKGKLIGITLKGEENKFKDWKNIYKCNNAIRENLNLVDSISFDTIYTSSYKYNVSIKYDTILRIDRFSLKNKDYIIDTIISSKTGNHRFDELYCRIAELELLGVRHNAINYNSIESFTFAHLDLNKKVKSSSNSHGGLCSGMNPIQCLMVLAIVAVPIVIYFTTDIIIEDIEAQVHIYNLKEWKIQIK